LCRPGSSRPICRSTPAFPLYLPQSPSGLSTTSELKPERFDIEIGAKGSDRRPLATVAIYQLDRTNARD
jgi:hypothetical protein